MIKNVVADLRVFIFFFSIQIIMFSIILDVLAVGNYIDHENIMMTVDSATEDDEDMTIPFNFGKHMYPGFEYRHCSLFFANFLRTIRFSLGDYDFGSITHLNEFESIVFWITWVITVLMTCIVFLNFIIAEVSQSYKMVQENVNELILQEKAILINESEEMML